MAKNKMTICKHCGAEIAAGAKTCPHCGGKNKKPVFKRVWFWLLIVVLVGVVAATAGGSGDGGSNTASGDKKQEEKAIEYTAVTVDEMMEALDGNAAAASDTYKDKYFEVTGLLSTIDSDGSYISLTSLHDEWDIIGITCEIQNDEQLEAVKKLSSGQEVTVKGKVTEVGEVLGYTLEIDEIE